VPRFSIQSARLIIAIGINIYDVPGRKSSYSQACIKLSIDDEVNRFAKQLQPIVQPMLRALFMI
jgi:hypothetical protein